jgi:hypothetical protein
MASCGPLLDIDGGQPYICDDYDAGNLLRRWTCDDINYQVRNVQCYDAGVISMPNRN